MTILFALNINRERERGGRRWKKSISSPEDGNDCMLGLNPFLYLKICMGIASAENCLST